MADERIPLEDEFGDIIGKARFGLKKSVADVANAARVSEADLNALENYERKPTRAESDALARALNLNADRLWAVATGAYQPAAETSDGDDTTQVIRLRNDVGFTVYAYLLVDRKSGDTAIVDTAAHPDQILAAIQAKGLKPRAILLTHQHADHIEGVDKLQKKTGVPVVAAKNAELPDTLENVVRLGDGETYDAGNVHVRLLETPGHTPGCAMYVTGNVAVSGDVLFAGSAGRGNYSYASVLSSIRDKVFRLPDSTRLYPGHGPSTTVGEEKAHNPFVG